MNDDQCSVEMLKALKSMKDAAGLPPEKRKEEINKIRDNCKVATKSCSEKMKEDINTHLESTIKEADKIISKDTGSSVKVHIVESIEYHEEHFHQVVTKYKTNKE